MLGICPVMCKLFDNLEARNTLETIVFLQMAVTKQLVGSIVEFGNLKNIICHNRTGLSSVVLKALGYLHRIRKIDYQDTV